jgi:hypothetical protein
MSILMWSGLILFAPSLLLELHSSFHVGFRLSHRPIRRVMLC